jgi:tetratricopeptide (TPR) repeat protein
MRQTGAILITLLAVLIPTLAPGQSNNRFITASPAPNPASAVTSVHELQIPAKARKECEKGTKLFAAKNSAESIPEFQKAIKTFPDYYEAYAKMGAAQLDLERWGDAEAAFRKAIELSKDHYAPADFGLGLILATVSKKFAEAEAIVRAGLEQSPTDVAGHFVLAWVLFSTARLQEAEENALQATVYDPKAASARLLLAQIHLSEKKYPEALQDLNAYLAVGIVGPLTDKARAVREQALRALGTKDPDAAISAANR